MCRVSMEGKIKVRRLCRGWYDHTFVDFDYEVVTNVNMMKIGGVFAKDDAGQVD